MVHKKSLWDNLITFHCANCHKIKVLCFVLLGFQYIQYSSVYSNNETLHYISKIILFLDVCRLSEHKKSRFANDLIHVTGDMKNTWSLDQLIHIFKYQKLFDYLIICLLNYLVIKNSSTVI